VVLALQFVDDHAAEIVAELVRILSVSGLDEENAVQHVLAVLMAELGMDVDVRQIQLYATLVEADFPGVEVERRDAWGVMGRLPGREAGPSLMLNAHVDVVPTCDPESWAASNPSVPDLGATGLRPRRLGHEGELGGLAVGARLRRPAGCRSPVRCCSAP
jgi:acetylornithine deacetylase